MKQTMLIGNGSPRTCNIIWLFWFMKKNQWRNQMSGAVNVDFLLISTLRSWSQGGLDHRLTNKLKGLFSSSALSSSQWSITKPTLLLMLHRSACPSYAPFHHNLWTKSLDFGHFHFDSTLFLFLSQNIKTGLETMGHFVCDFVPKMWTQHMYVLTRTMWLEATTSVTHSLEIPPLKVCHLKGCVPGLPTEEKQQ